jgi:hypothetical protein
MPGKALAELISVRRFLSALLSICSGLCVWMRSAEHHLSSMEDLDLSQHEGFPNAR